MSTNLLSTDDAVGFGGVVKEFLWNWENQSLRVVYETLGQGAPLLLLPAFSSVSTREEMGELARLLAPHFQVVAVDWLVWRIFSPQFRLPSRVISAIFSRFY